MPFIENSLFKTLELRRQSVDIVLLGNSEKIRTADTLSSNETTRYKRVLDYSILQAITRIS